MRRPGSAATIRSTKTNRMEIGGARSGRPRPWPSGSRRESSGARELRHDVLADGAHGEAVHDGVERARRVEAAVEIAGEPLDREAREIERSLGQIVDYALDQLAHERALVAVGARHAVLGRHVREARA